jgi:hypothetical protein
LPSQEGLQADSFSSVAWDEAVQSPNDSDASRSQDAFPGSRSYHGSSAIPKPHFRTQSAQNGGQNGPENIPQDESDSGDASK